MLNTAKYYQAGELVNIPGKDLMAHAKPYYINPAFAFVAYPNRDSTGFRIKYNIPEAGTVIRGTLRYQGFPEFVKCLVEMGFLDETPKDYLKPGTNATWVSEHPYMPKSCAKLAIDMAGGRDSASHCCKIEFRGSAHCQDLLTS